MANPKKTEWWGKPTKTRNFRIPQDEPERGLIAENVKKLLDHCKGMTPEELREFEFKFCNEKQYDAMCKVANQGNLKTDK